MLIVGIPVKNDLDSLREMLSSLTLSTDVHDKIVIVVGKGTNQVTMDYLNKPYLLNTSKDKFKY